MAERSRSFLWVTFKTTEGKTIMVPLDSILSITEDRDATGIYCTVLYVGSRSFSVQASLQEILAELKTLDTK